MNNYSTADRRQAILDAILAEPIATQAALVRALRRRGIRAAQASVSRDVAELGLVKQAGRWRAAPAAASPADPELPLRAWVRNASAAGPNLVVVRCDAGAAQRVALALDALRKPEVVGTVAGDDTVFAAVRGTADARRLVRFVESRRAATGA